MSAAEHWERTTRDELDRRQMWTSQAERTKRRARFAAGGNWATHSNLAPAPGDAHQGEVTYPDDAA